jgi:diaminopimelate epimerase
VESTRILTQIPTRQPKVITIGTDSLNARNWVNLGSPGRIPRDVVSPIDITPLDDDIDTINDISITFREGDLHPFSNRTSLKLNGFLVYTGEPHLVIFPETGFSISELQKFFFISSHQTTSAINSQERRIRFGSWLIDHIGMQLNKQYPHIFPNGINVNFVNIPAKNNAIEYRCFERGINKETLACGTGALASSFVSQRLGLTKEGQVSVWPHRCRWYDPKALILVDQNKQQWSLYGKPAMLLDGIFIVDKVLARRLAALEAENIILDHGHQLEHENIHHLANANH